MRAMAEPRRVYLHIGQQKTGTSYLQSVYFENADAVTAQGVDLVPPTKRQMFRLMLVVRERVNLDHDPATIVGALARFSEQLAKAPAARALLSDESFASCQPEQAERLVAACHDREVHVVVTTRDIARQMPSAWQQSIKSSGTETYADYLQRLRAREGSARPGRTWLHLDAAVLVRRWRELVPAEQIHVVTVPHSSADPTELLRRYSGVLGVDPTGFTTETARPNPGLGRVQAEVLRRMNEGLDQDISYRQLYGAVGKRFFGETILAAQGGDKTRVPASLESWVREVSERSIDHLGSGGYDIVGSLDDLRSPASAFSTADEHPPTEDEVRDVALQTLTDLLNHRLATTESQRRTQHTKPGQGKGTGQGNAKGKGKAKGA